MKLKFPFLLLLTISLVYSCRTDKKYTTWEQYKGSGENIHYSSLTQVDTTNVKNLKVAWEYHTHDADTVNYSQIQTNPIIVDGILFGVSPKMKLFAIDAHTGKEKWAFNPFDSMPGDKRTFFILNNCRGVAYWSDGGKDSRIFYTAGSRLYCINAKTGKPVKDFGSGGHIDLHDELDRDVKNLFVNGYLSRHHL